MQSEQRRLWTASWGGPCELWSWHVGGPGWRGCHHSECEFKRRLHSGQKRTATGERRRCRRVSEQVHILVTGSPMPGISIMPCMVLFVIPNGHVAYSDYLKFLILGRRGCPIAAMNLFWSSSVLFWLKSKCRKCPCNMPILSWMIESSLLVQLWKLKLNIRTEVYKDRRVSSERDCQVFVFWTVLIHSYWFFLAPFFTIISLFLFCCLHWIFLTCRKPAKVALYCTFEEKGCSFCGLISLFSGFTF